MNGFGTEPIILSGGQAMEFIDSLRMPDAEYLNRRNKLFSKMDEQISLQRNGLDIEVEIAGLDLSFIDELDDKDRSVSLKLSTEFEFVLNDKAIEGKNCRKISEESVTLLVETYDYKDNRERVSCWYNEITKGNYEATVKDKTGAHMTRAHKIEQITFAA